MRSTNGLTDSAALAVPRLDVADESGNSSADGRARKRVQRTAHSARPTPSKPAAIVPSAEQRPGFHTRRRSTAREHQTPLGPRPLDRSNSTRRLPSDGQAGNVPSLTRSFLPTVTNDPPAGQMPRGSNPRFSFGKHSDSSKVETDSTGSLDFLPSVNFDDFHASITAPFEPDLTDFPAPGGGHGILTNFRAQRTTSNTSSNRSVSGERSDVHDVARKPFPRRLSAVPRQAPPKTSDPSSMPPPNGPLSLRTRRQSQFPAPPPTNAAGRPPRKSVGPGFLPSPLDVGHGATDPGPMTAADGRSRLGRTFSHGKSGRPGLLNRGPPTSEPQVLAPSARSAKAKSLQPPPRQANHLASSDDGGESTPLAQFLPPIRSPVQNKDGTPSSSSSKRQSVMPSHASGLGARTISPTDARRLKRLSVLPQPPLPQSPPAFPADFSPGNLSAPHSPALPTFPLRKDSGPLSARATPEQGRKSAGPGHTLSASSSFNSLRTASTNPNRSSQNLSGSRLPTPKPRNVHSSAGGHEEEVPPVPAIPKAYESPKDPASPWTQPRKSSQQHDPAGWGVYAVESVVSQEPAVVEPPKPDALTNDMRKPRMAPRHRRGMTVGAGSDADKPQGSQNVSRKNLQPLRLPPLNLLPLSTPTNSRIASLPGPAAEVNGRTVTPPASRNATKTPSTPMTASKASFFHRAHKEDDEIAARAPLRSSSSHHHLRSGSSNFAPDPPAKPMPIPGPTRHATTPFSSNSLPKHSGELERLRSRPSGEYKPHDVDSDYHAGKVVGPRAQAGKKDSSSVNTSTSDEPETPTSGTSLRRKLSLGWKRSGSKASHASQPSKEGTDEPPPQPPKHHEMPPPRFPASATWSATTGHSPSPSTKPRGSLDTRRPKPSASGLQSDNEADRLGARRGSAAAGQHRAAPRTDHAPAASRSTPAMTPMQRLLGPKNPTSTLKARNLDTHLDKEDRAADEEMKRLTSKRKDFEGAAREVDELRKRARPNERVSPTQALQLVTLNIFERGEIIDYKEVFFCGTKSAKKHVGDLNSSSANFGYDDERGDYNIVIGDHLAYRYEVVDVLGKGSFGQVVRCVDHKTGGLVAIKIIRNKKRFHQQALVEVNILQKLQDWDPEHRHSMIKFTQSFYFRGHLCISTELLGMNLYEFIKAFEFRGFSVRLIRRFTRQMLNALVLLQGRRVIHCDLKPENILLAHPLHSEIKVIDFGSSCFEHEKVYTYIQSRFYRSPEVILGMSYGMPIDMWSLGCILAELLTGYPIFPGENEQEQLACIMEIFGPPEKHLIEKSSRKKLFFDSLGKPRVTVSSKGRRRRPSSKTLQQALKCDDEAFLDFISRCLRWDPDRRLKPDEALHHEFVTATRKPPTSRFGAHSGAARPARTHTNGLSAGPTAAPATSAASSSAGTSSTAPSPMKRTVAASAQHTPQRAAGGGGGASASRPLPEPPATSFRNGTAVRNPSASPIKPSLAPRRHSTVHGAGGGAGGVSGLAGIKRASNGAAIAAAAGSSLPRAAAVGGAGRRSVSGKPDLASAAAAASLKTR